METIKLKPPPHVLGRLGEETALRYLKRKKFRIIETHFRMFRGEIDIIAKDGPTLVFVEVKARCGSGFGEPEEALTIKKQQQLRRIAQGYLTRFKLEESPCRFDVVALDLNPENLFAIRHYKDAF